jgi:hypothetical protein
MLRQGLFVCEQSLVTALKETCHLRRLANLSVLEGIFVLEISRAVLTLEFVVAQHPGEEDFCLSWCVLVICATVGTALFQVRPLAFVKPLADASFVE